MVSIRNYVLRVVAAAIVCGISGSIVKEKTATGKMLNLISGILMAVTILSPLASISFQNISNFYADISADADSYISEGTIASKQEIAGIIKSQTEAYILDKANNLGLQISVEVELDDGNYSIPCGVEITGAISPYAKGVLGTYMQEQLGIPKENQKWK